MPIHNLGYREWKGELEPSSTRWTVVAEIGIRRAWQSSWLRRLKKSSQEGMTDDEYLQGGKNE